MWSICCTIFKCFIPQVKVFGSDSTSIKSEELTKLPESKSEPLPSLEVVSKIFYSYDHNFDLYSCKTYKHEHYIYKDLAEYYTKNKIINRTNTGIKPVK